MSTKLVSFDQMQAFLGDRGPWEVSTNHSQIQAAQAVLRRAIPRELTRRQQECVRLYFYEKLTMEEVGRELGISKSTVCRHLQRAKRRLERTVSYVGVACQFVGDD